MATLLAGPAFSAVPETPSSEFADGEILDRQPCSWPDFASYADWREFMAGGPPNMDERIYDEFFTEAAYERFRRGEDTRCEKIVYVSSGLRIVGFLVQPVGSPAPAPAVVYNRGGYGTYGRILFWDLLHMMDLASRGYAVVASEYRGNWGSEGHDEGGGADVEDVLNLLRLIDRLPNTDGERIGMLGWSRGGGMTYQSLARTDRIDAAILVAAGTDAFDSAQRRPDAAAALEPLKHATDDVARERLERSPLRWPERLHPETPILILHGSSDWRVHPGQALAMATRLFELRHPTRFILYEGADHMLNEYRADVWREIVAWLDRYVRDQEPRPDMEPHGR